MNEQQAPSTDRRTSPPMDTTELADALKVFLATAPSTWEPGDMIKRLPLPGGEHVSCVLWNNLFYITGTDIVRSLVYRFHAFGRPVSNIKKFEEGVFSDLRNLKSGVDACLEEPRSEFLEFLYKSNCIRTQKKQKVFYWFSVPHDRLFLDALERDLKREALGQDPITIAINPMPVAPTLERAKQQCMPSIVPNILMRDDNHSQHNNSQQQLYPYRNENSQLGHVNPQFHPGYPHPQQQHSGPSHQFVQEHGFDDWIADDVVDHHHHHNQYMHPRHGHNTLTVPSHPHPSLHSPVSSDSSPYLSHTSPELSNRSSPDPSSESDTDPNHVGGYYHPQQQYHPNLPPLPEPNYITHSQTMFSLFDGSPNYKNRRRPPTYSTPLIPSGPTQITTTYRRPTPQDRRNYTCTYESCNRKFKRYEHLRRHTRCHTGEKPYVCPVETCKKMFSRSDNLTQHLKVHGNRGESAGRDRKKEEGGSGSVTPTERSGLKIEDGMVAKMEGASLVGGASQNLGFAGAPLMMMGQNAAMSSSAAMGSGGMGSTTMGSTPMNTVSMPTPTPHHTHTQPQPHISRIDIDSSFEYPHRDAEASFMNMSMGQGQSAGFGEAGWVGS